MVNVLAKREPAKHRTECGELVERVAAVEVVPAQQHVYVIRQIGDQSQFLAELVVILDAAGCEEIGRAAIEILAHVLAVRAITGG